MVYNETYRNENSMNIRRTAQIVNPANIVNSTRVWAWYKIQGYDVPLIRVITT